MKYLSQSTQFSGWVVIDDTTPATTPPTGKATIEFPKLQASDSTGSSRYIVGGRTYFEAWASAPDVASFTFKGFFDEAGYEEPKSTLNKLKSSGWLYVIIAACVLVVAAAIFFYCYCSKKKETAAKKQKNE